MEPKDNLSTLSILPRQYILKTYTLFRISKADTLSEKNKKKRKKEKQF